MCVLLGGNRLDGGLHGAPRQYDALHAQVGIEFLYYSLVGVALCHFVVCHWASSPCYVHCSCYLLSCILSSGNLSLLCSVLLLFIK